MPTALDVIDETIAELEARLNLKPGGQAIKGVDGKREALELIDDTIAELEARLHWKPAAGRAVQKGADDGKGATVVVVTDETRQKSDKKETKQKQQQQRQQVETTTTTNNEDQPDICKLEFKVGQIVKVWVHPKADKLYCEEINVGEAEPRQIASGLRPHFTLEQMMGQRLLVASNLKAKNLVGFKSHGMVLCAAATPLDDDPGKETVEFVEPPEGAAIGEVITFEGLPKPEPFSSAQVEKRKVWQTAAEGMKTTNDCLAAWNGHVFMTSAGPCKTKTIANGVMR